MQSIYDFEVTTIDGRRQRLEAYRGQVLVIVNVASRCTLTPQYAALEALYRKYRHESLSILGFPCDQFGHQEPGGEAEIKGFCQLTYNVTFPLFAKIEVKGQNAHPLYQFLKSAQPGFLGSKSIKWNFTKFLVDRQARVVRRLAPQARAKSLERALRPLLAERVAAI